MLYRGSAGNRKHHRRLPEQPCYGHLHRLCAKTLGCFRQWTAALGQVSGRKRKPWYESDPFARTILQYILRGPIDQVVPILHRCHRRHFAYRLDLLHAYFGQPDVSNLALSLKIEQRADLIFQSHLWVDSVKLEEIDPLESEPPKAALARRTKVLGTAVFDPLVRTGPLKTCLRRNHKISFIRVQRLGDKALRNFRTVRIRCIDQRYA